MPELPKCVIQKTIQLDSSYHSTPHKGVACFLSMLQQRIHFSMQPFWPQFSYCSGWSAAHRLVWMHIICTKAMSSSSLRSKPPSGPPPFRLLREVKYKPRQTNQTKGNSPNRWKNRSAARSSNCSLNISKIDPWDRHSFPFGIAIDFL